MRPESAKADEPAMSSNHLRLTCTQCGALMDVGDRTVLSGAHRRDWWCRSSSSMVRRAVVVALVVGTCLTAINQGDTLLQLRFPAALLWKIPLSYAVPFVVSTYSASVAASSGGNGAGLVRRG